MLRALQFRNRISGKGELNFPETNGEELHALAPDRIASGFRYSLSYPVSDMKILEGPGS
jgi:acetoacetate decarboxylase